MPLSEDFPRSPFSILDPECRWYPDKKTIKKLGYERLLPPLVYELRIKVGKWRESGYEGASNTSKSLLNWWFERNHKVYLDGMDVEFKFYFAQREAVETIIYLHEIAGIEKSVELMKFSRNEDVTKEMFPEDWQRYVVKMATGSGKTKVMTLVLAWSFFHKTYENDSKLSRNFLLVTPNIIVLDRIRKDFDGLKVFFDDPVIPDNGYDGQYWRDDFQLKVHIQDDVRITEKTGNIFVTNIHRVFMGNRIPPSLEDENTLEYFVGPNPVARTTDSSIDLGEIVRDIEELAILNDEAHHIHDEKLAWSKCIRDIHNNLVHKGKNLAFQVDVTATPKHNDGSIFVQTICDYPLVEAIAQSVVKLPILPDAPSREKLKERKSIRYVDKYKDYIDLGVQEWAKVYKINAKLGKKSVLFIMTDNTQDCDRVAEYLETHYKELDGAVLTIHTKNNGDISESQTGKKKDELEKLRKQAKEIDSWDSPYKAIVSVMMLKEGWDVRNVTTIIGLRPYKAKSNILPEQTLGRGLRRMYFPGVNDFDETSDSRYESDMLCVIGTKAFIEFIEDIKNDGVKLGYKKMDINSLGLAPVVIEVEKENDEKPIENLDIEFPIVIPPVTKDINEIKNLNPKDFEFKPVKLKNFSKEEQREIIFKDFEKDKEVYKITLDGVVEVEWVNIVKFFVRQIDNKYHFGNTLLTTIFSKMKEFIQFYLFDQEVLLEDLNVIRNLSENNVHKTIIDTFGLFINDMIVKPNITRPIIKKIKLSETRSFRKTKNQKYIYDNPKKCAFNMIACDSGFEVEFAKFLDLCSDVMKWSYNYRNNMSFVIDYVNDKGDVSKYYPDFWAVGKNGVNYIIETKGQIGIEVPRKMEALRDWCLNLNKQQNEEYDYIFVDLKSYNKYRPNNLEELLECFTEYK